METFWQDLRFGGRTLLRSPGFAAIAVITLAIGIGANAAIFSVVNAVLLRPLPWSDPDRAVMIWSKWTAFDKTWVATGEVVDYRKRSRTLQDVATWSDGQVNLTGDGEPERVSAANVSANTFSTLGVQPLVGRAFTSQEDLPNGPRLVVLGFGLWNRRYSGDTSIVGRSILINGNAFEVVGIMPPGFVLPTDFRNPEPSQLWTPLQMDPASTDHGSHGLYAAGRLKDGATVREAAADLHGIAQAMTREGLYPVQMKFDTVVLSLTEEVIGSVRRSIWLLFGAVGFLLLIACANVANLLLARAEARQREIAVRSALGAGRLRVLRQLLTESLVLTGISAAMGLALAYAGVRLVAWWNPASIPRVAGAALDLRVLLFTAIVALCTSVLFSLAPALRALRVDLTDSLKDGGQSVSSGGSRQQFRNALVVVEMALAVVLLVGAGLMLRSIWALQRVPIGFDPAGVLTMRVSLPAASYASPEQVVAFYQRLLERVRQLPGVQTAGAARLLPLGSTIGDWGLMVDGYVPPPGTGAKGDWQIVTDGYFDAIGERVVRGRGILPGRHERQPARRPRQRGARAKVLLRPRSDWRTHADRRRQPESAIRDRRRHRRGRPAQRAHGRRQGKVLRTAHAVAQVNREFDPIDVPGGEDDERSDRAHRTDSQRDSKSGSIAAGGERADHGRDRRRDDVEPAVHRVPARDVRGDGAAPVRDRDLRRAVVPRQPAHA